MRDYVLAFALIFAVNLLPAFGPPTWALLVFFRLSYGLDTIPLVLGGALAAASGRYVLATAARRLRSRLSPRRRDSLAAALGLIAGSRRKAAAGLGLFALSPVPSAQLFVGAGLLGVPLLPLTLAFLGGRLVSYSLYVGAASLAADSLGDVLVDWARSPLGLALQLAMLAALVALVRVEWPALLAHRRHGRPGASPRPRRQDRTRLSRAGRSRPGGGAVEARSGGTVFSRWHDPAGAGGSVHG